MPHRVVLAVAGETPIVRTERELLLEYAERCSTATELIHVVLAAGILYSDLMGLPIEPYPNAA